MQNPFRIETVWGESGPQKALQRRPGVSPPIPEQLREQAGKRLGSSAYGTAVPIAVGQIRTQAVLVEDSENSFGRVITFAICEGQVDSVGPVSIDGKTATPYIEDPTNFVPGSYTQGTGGATKSPYLGRAIAWRTIAKNAEIPALSYEVNGRPAESLQDVELHSYGPSSADVYPQNYQAETFCRGDEVHIVYVVASKNAWNELGASWDLVYRSSADGGVTWTSPEVIATVAHPIPHPIVFGDPDGADVQIVWFHKRQWKNGDRDIDLRNVYKSTGVWSSPRIIYSYTYSTYNPDVEAQLHLSGTSRGGVAWVSYQDYVLNRTSSVGTHVFVANATSGQFLGRILSLQFAGTPQDMSIEGIVLSGSPDGSVFAALHLKTSYGKRHLKGLQVYRIVNDGGYPDWDPSIRHSVGVLKYDVAANTLAAKIDWDHGIGSDKLEDILTGGGYIGFGLPPLPVNMDYFGRIIPYWYRIQYLGTVNGKPDCWVLLYKFGPNADGNDSVALTPWRLRMGSGMSDPAPVDVDLGGTATLHCAPRWSFAGTRLTFAYTIAQQRIDDIEWGGSSCAYRDDYELASGVPVFVSLMQRMSYVAGNDDLAYAACPTPNGMIVMEHGDFDVSDAQVGRFSRLIAWDPSAETAGGDVDPVGILVRALVSEKHLGPVWRAESSEFFGIVKNATETDKYCRIMGFTFSDSITSQVGAWDHIAAIMASANCDAVWSDGRLEFVPHEVLSLAGGGETWTPQPGRASPAYSLSASDFLAPLQPSRRAVSDEKSILPISFSDRPQNYRTNTLDLMDAGATEYRGAKKASTVDCPWITRKSVAATSAWLRLRKNAISRTTWEGRLPWRFQRLQAMDLVSVTEPRLGLSGEICRVRRLTRHSDCSLTVVLESAGAEYSVPTSPILDDADVTTPVWFAPSILDASLAVVPVEYTGQASPGVLFAVAGPPEWQGSDIWVRWVINDVPAEWTLVGEVLESTPMGYLTEEMGSLAPRPDLRPHAGLMPGAQDDWAGEFGLVQIELPSPSAAYSTGIPPALARIGQEFATHFERANGTWVHRAKTLRRGLWGSTVETHAPGTRVVVFRAGTPTWIVTGRGTLEVRFPSKATRGSAAEPLEATRSYFVEVP